MKRQTERKLRARTQKNTEDIAEYFHDVLDMCRIIHPDMSEEARVDHLFRGVNAALYERLYVLGIKTCDEFLEKARLHEDAVRTAYERGYCAGETAAVAAVGSDLVQELKKHIKELEERLAQTTPRRKWDKG